jgi:hypothetical protein
MVGRLSGITINRDGTQNITVTVNTDFSNEYDELKDKDINVEIKKYSRRRSLDANAYCWTIIDKIAEKTGLKKAEVYRNAIKEIGGVSTIICVKEEAADSLCDCWSSHGMGWLTERSPSKIPGCTNVMLWYGSSVYSTSQMNALVNSLIQDAEALNISTITPKEQERLLAQWGRKIEKKAGAA